MTGDERTVIVMQDKKSMRVLRTFTVPTAQVREKDKFDIQTLAETVGQYAHFFSVEGWSGIESVKFDIKEGPRQEVLEFIRG